MKLGIIIPHYQKDQNSTWLLRTCLKSIQRFHPELIASTVICDDASPCTLEELKEVVKDFKVTILRREVNTSYAANVNMGLKFLRFHRCELAIIMNNDITFTMPFLVLTEYFKRIADLAIVGMKLYFPDGRLQHGGIEIDETKNISHPGYGLWEDGAHTRFVPIVTGAFQIVHLYRVGMYPENYQLSYEDVAFCLRAWEREKLVLYCAEVSALHNESATRGYLLGPKEHQSLNEHHRAQFQLPEVLRRVAQAQADFSHEQLSLRFDLQRAWQVWQARQKPDHPQNLQNLEERWDQARTRLKLDTVAPEPIVEKKPRRESPYSLAKRRRSKRLRLLTSSRDERSRDKE